MTDRNLGAALALLALPEVIDPCAPLNDKRPRSHFIPRTDERLVEALS